MPKIEEIQEIQLCTEHGNQMLSGMTVEEIATNPAACEVHSMVAIGTAYVAYTTSLLESYEKYEQYLQEHNVTKSFANRLMALVDRGGGTHEERMELIEDWDG